MRNHGRLVGSILFAGLLASAPGAEPSPLAKAGITVAKPGDVPAPPPGSAFGDAAGGFERAIVALKQILASAEGAEVFEGLPHPFEKETLETEKRKPTVRFDGEWFYAQPIPLEKNARGEIESLLGEPALTPFRGMKLCGGFHADYAVRWTPEKGGTPGLALFCFGCGEARVILGGERWTTDLSADGAKKLKAFFAPFRRERPAPQFRTETTPPARP